jgi:hypothetical protein
MYDEMTGIPRMASGSFEPKRHSPSLVMAFVRATAYRPECDGGAGDLTAFALLGSRRFRTIPVLCTRLLVRSAAAIWSGAAATRWAVCDVFYIVCRKRHSRRFMPGVAGSMDVAGCNLNHGSRYERVRDIRSRAALRHICLPAAPQSTLVPQLPDVSHALLHFLRNVFEFLIINELTFAIRRWKLISPARHSCEIGARARVP